MFKLGKNSIARLQGVDPRLVRVVRRAIQLTTQDFTVLEGVRTVATQRDYVARGASQTMDSRHLVQADGLGKAVDLVPWAGGVPRWEWPLIWPIAEAMRQAAIAEGVPIRWGGSWERLDLIKTPAGVKRSVDAYTAARRAQKRAAFLDGPHYEIPKGF